MVTVLFSPAQRRLTGGVDRVEIEAKRVDALVRALVERFPDLEAASLDRAAVSIDGVLHNDARYQPLPEGAEVMFVGAVAGGSGARVGPGLDGSGVSGREGADPLGCAQAWRAAGRGVAIATVVETWGSSPCPSGSQLAVDDAGHFEGSVSGGCVEGAVIEAAGEVIASGEPVSLEFGVADADAWAVGLACGGRVRIYVERIA